MKPNNLAKLIRDVNVELLEWDSVIIGDNEYNAAEWNKEKRDKTQEAMESAINKVKSDATNPNREATLLYDFYRTFNEHKFTEKERERISRSSEWYMDTKYKELVNEVLWKEQFYSQRVAAKLKTLWYFGLDGKPLQIPSDKTWTNDLIFAIFVYQSSCVAYNELANTIYKVRTWKVDWIVWQAFLRSLKTEYQEQCKFTATDLFKELHDLQLIIDNDKIFLEQLQTSIKKAPETTTEEFQDIKYSDITTWKSLTLKVNTKNYDIQNPSEYQNISSNSIKQYKYTINWWHWIITKNTNPTGTQDAWTVEYAQDIIEDEQPITNIHFTSATGETITFAVNSSSPYDLVEAWELSKVDDTHYEKGTTSWKWLIIYNPNATDVWNAWVLESFEKLVTYSPYQLNSNGQTIELSISDSSPFELSTTDMSWIYYTDGAYSLELPGIGTWRISYSPDKPTKSEARTGVFEKVKEETPEDKLDTEIVQYMTDTDFAQLEEGKLIEYYKNTLTNENRKLELKTYINGLRFDIFRKKADDIGLYDVYFALDFAAPVSWEQAILIDQAKTPHWLTATTSITDKIWNQSIDRSTLPTHGKYEYSNKTLNRTDNWDEFLSFEIIEQ